MMKKYYFCYIALVLFLFIPFNNAFALEIDSNCIIDNYDIEMIVNENNTYDITEKIDIVYATPSYRNNKKNTFKKYSYTIEWTISF